VEKTQGGRAGTDLDEKVDHHVAAFVHDGLGLQRKKISRLGRAAGASVLVIGELGLLGNISTQCVFGH
jgi:hypothetical protein